MGRPPDFSKQTVDTLAKRAGYLCTNPDCNAPTVGANKSPDRAVNIGEAAHIYGAKPNSARFVASMIDKERSQIVNAIWLCSRCHKLVDDDEKYYDDELLYKWKEFHDYKSAWAWQQKSAAMKREMAMDHLDQFASYPPRIQRIVLDKPEFWEGQLTKDLLNFILKPIFSEYEAVTTGALVPDTILVRSGEEPLFIRTRLAEAERIIGSLSALYTSHLIQSWGPSGKPGEEHEILKACERIGLTVKRAVEWEAQFSGVMLEDDSFKKVFSLVSGAVGMQLEEVKKVNDAISRSISQVMSSKSGVPISVHHQMVFDIPEDFVTNIEVELARLAMEKGHGRF